MLLFLGQRILNVTVDVNCEDDGLLAVRDLAPSSAISILLWIPVALAAGNVEYLLASIWRHGWPTYRVVRVVSPLVFVMWVFFTFFSMISLLQFGRASVSFAFKFVHVAFELLNLVLFFLMWGWTGHALATTLLALFGIFASFSLSCEVLYHLTSIGAVLDSLNFFICAYQLNRYDHTPLRYVTLAFFFHATYIWAFLWMTYGMDSSDGKVLLRAYGVLANCVAVHFGTSALVAYRREEHLSIGSRDVSRKDMRDSMFIDGDADLYVLGTEGTRMPRTWVGSALISLSTLTSGLFYVNENNDGDKEMFAIFGSVGVLRPAVWRAGTHAIGAFAERMLKSGSWLIFSYLLMLFLFLDAHMSSAVIIAWLAPATVAGVIFQIIMVFNRKMWFQSIVDKRAKI